MRVSFGQVYKLNFETEEIAKKAAATRNTDGRKITEGKSVYYIPSSDMKIINDITNMMTGDKDKYRFINREYITDIFKKNAIVINCKNNPRKA